jgi:serine/threonine-protein kinase RsbW
MTHPYALQFDAVALGDLARIRAFVRESALELGLAPDAADDVVLAVDEAVTNAIRHGYTGGAGPLALELGRRGSELLVRLVDEAPVFDPTRRPAPDVDLPLASRPLGGMGIHLMHASVDRMSHRSRGRSGNDLTFVKRVAAGEGRDRS